MGTINSPTEQTPTSEQTGQVTCSVCKKKWVPDFGSDCYNYDGVDMCERCMYSFAFCIREPELVGEQHVNSVCRIGEAAQTCAFLLMSPKGPACAKATSYENTIRRRLGENTSVAKGDNCSGPPVFRIIK